jgi:hypothetical protein
LSLESFDWPSQFSADTDELPSISSHQICKRFVKLPKVKL